MSNTRTYRLLTGNHGRFEGKTPVQYHRGDLLELTDAEAEYLGKRVELAGGETAPEAPQDRPEVEAEPTPAPLGLSTLHWAKAAKLVSELETVEAAQRAREEELAGKARKGVLDAADSKLRTLKDNFFDFSDADLEGVR